MLPPVRASRWLAVVATMVACAVSGPLPAGASTAAPSVVSLCPAPTAGHATCFAEELVTSGAKPMTGPQGYGPADLQSAYDLPSSIGGVGETVYVVDAYNDTTAESDLARYRTEYGLPECSTADGCFEKLNQTGTTSPMPGTNSGWTGETSLDLDMVSAVCPNCSIRLIEAKDTGAGLYTAVREAVTLGAKFVSMSWGSAESTSDASIDASTFDQPGVAYVASSGDNGYYGGIAYPSSSPHVLSVGGTSLVPDSSSRGWSETAWGHATGGAGAVSGCSWYEAKPDFQSFIPSALCAGRATADVSADADPSTGVAVAAAGGWRIMGGTSASAPMIAAMYALAGAPAGDSHPETFPSSNASHLNDVTAGSTGTCGSLLCNAGVGWDGPTGLGTPDGIGAFSGTGSDVPVIDYLGGRITAATATPGLPTSVSVTPVVPDGRTLASVAWTASRKDCSFDDATALDANLTCNAADAGTVKVTAALVDSSGAQASLTSTVPFVVSKVKRPVAVSLAVDSQTDSASVCTGDSAPVRGTVVDVATGDPVKGVTVKFGKRAATATSYASSGSAVTGADGVAVGKVAASVASVYEAASNAVGGFQASTAAAATESVAVAACAPQLQAAVSTTTPWYGDTVTVTGSVERADPADPSGADTIPVGGATVHVMLQAPNVTSASGRTTTPAPSQVASATSAPDGTFSVTFKAAKAGALTARISPSAGFSAASADLGDLAVSVPTSAVDATVSETSVAVGTKVTVSGTLTKTAASEAPLARTGVSIRLLRDGAKTPTTIGSATTSATGTFTASVKIPATGDLSVVYAGGAAVVGSSADLGEMTVG